MTIEQEIRNYQASCKENFQMLNERPPEMSFEAYKLLLKMQRAGISKYIKGQQIFVSKNFRSDEKGKSLIKKK